MTPQRWARLKEVFADAMERDPAHRESFVREAVQDDLELAGEVLRLVRESERESDLLSRPALADASAVTQDEGPRFAAPAVLARRFRIVRFIARGGMGEVYEAEDLELGGRVALKAIRPRAASDDGLRALFKREIQLARRVTHPNVCRIFDLGQHEDSGNGDPTLLLSMELIEGQTLAEYLRWNGPLNVRSALPLIEDIAAGLQAVHDAGIVHGDLKPGNVMLVTRPGETAPRAVVMDFGMAFPKNSAAAPGSNDTSSEPEAVFVALRDNRAPAGALPDPGPLFHGGTPDYLAPEQTEGQTASTASDIYAFGLIIGEMLGLPPGGRVQHDNGAPSRWSRILGRCLAADPRRRYSRPVDVAAALRQALKHPSSRLMRSALLAGFALLLLVLAAKRIETLGGRSNRLILTEGTAQTVRAASPDGKLLATTLWDTGDLALEDINTGRIRRLTHRLATSQNQFGGAYGALFSPDGRNIAFQWMNSRTDSELRIIGANGKGERTLQYGLSNGFSLVDWSPDGRFILAAVGLFGHPARFALISAEDGSVHVLPTQPQVAAGGRVRFGEDGNSIVFDTRGPNDSQFEIHRLSLAGTESRVVANSGSSSIMGWSPDRQRLIFASDRRGRRGIWAVSVTDRGTQGEPREIVPDVANWKPLGISRNGSLFYRHDASSMDVYTAVLDLAAGRTIIPPRRVSERWVGSFASPDWSEDGMRLVFDSNRDPAVPRLGIFETQTARLRELSIDLSYSWRPQWIEHGSAIMVLGKAHDGTEGQFRVDARNGEVKLFRTSKELESSSEGVWSRDGTLHYNRYTDFRRGIFRLDVRTGERRLLYAPPPGVDVGMENLALSPDGRTLAFHARNGAAGTSTLMLIPAEGGESRPLLVLHLPESFRFGAFAWTPDSGAILAARTRTVRRTASEENTSELWRVPVDGSPPAKIDFPSVFVTCLRLNPDGKTIAFHVPGWRSEIWVIQNFL